MIIQIENNSTPSDYKKLAENWLELIYLEKYEDAYASTYHDPYYNWTPNLIKKVIEGYGIPIQNISDKINKPSKPISNLDNKNVFNVEIYEKPYIANFMKATIFGEIQHLIGLNNEWSDLTVEFLLIKVENKISLCLTEIHVF